LISIERITCGIAVSNILPSGNIFSYGKMLVGSRSPMRRG